MYLLFFAPLGPLRTAAFVLLPWASVFSRQFCSYFVIVAGTLRSHTFPASPVPGASWTIMLPHTCLLAVPHSSLVGALPTLCAPVFLFFFCNSVYRSHPALGTLTFTHISSSLHYLCDFTHACSQTRFNAACLALRSIVTLNDVVSVIFVLSQSLDSVFLRANSCQRSCAAFPFQLHS